MIFRRTWMVPITLEWEEVPGLIFRQEIGKIYADDYVELMNTAEKNSEYMMR